MLKPLLISRGLRRAAHWILATLMPLILGATCHGEESKIATAQTGSDRLETRPTEKLDRDGNGAVSLDEYLAEVGESDRPARRWTFYELDFDADGWLSEEELANDDPAKLNPHLQNFRRADVDQSGFVSRDEYVEPAKPKFEAAAKLEFAMFDRDEDEELTFEEFCFTPRINLERAPKFRRLDVDHSGRLTCQEFLRPYAPSQRPAQRSVFYHWDGDNDQQLSLEEFVKQGEGVTLSLRNKYLARDVDDDGRLSREEYFRPFIGSQWDQAAKNEAAQNDVDGDGFLTLLEFSLTPQERPFAEEILPLMDADGDGFLNRAEFVKPHPRIRWLEAGARFCRFDKNGDGRLDRDEFIHQGQGDWLRPDPLVKIVEAILRGIEPICSEADRDGDGRLTAGEWPRERLDKSAGLLAGIPFRDWDRDGDGVVTATDRRLLVEIALGIRRPDGQPLQKPGGYILNWASIRYLDKDHDDSLSRDEFVSGFWEGPKNAERFQEWDKDGDGRLTFGELLALPGFFLDAYAEFARIDANSDGRATTDELVAQAAAWQKAMASRLVAAFDSDANGSLGPDEFVLTPFANPVADWYVLRPDADNDGRLSPQEYYAERSPFLLGIARHYFARFDRDGDGFLSRSEFDFPVDIEKIPAAAALAALDADADGRLVLEELVEPDRPKSDDPTVLLRWEEKTMRVEEAFRAGDTDRDGALTLEEFGKQQASLTAAILGKAAPSSWARVKAGASGSAGANSEESWNWRLIGIVACNGLLLVGAVWMVLKRS